MALVLKAMLGGLMIAVGVFPPAEVNPSVFEIADLESSAVRERADGLMTVAWTQKFIRVGPGSNTDRWRCSVNINGTVYFSTGFIESSARSKLAARTNKPPLCRRNDREFFGFGS